MLCYYNYYRIFPDSTVRESLHIVAADVRSDFPLLGSGSNYNQPGCRVERTRSTHTAAGWIAINQTVGKIHLPAGGSLLARLPGQ